MIFRKRKARSCSLSPAPGFYIVYCGIILRHGIGVDLVDYAFDPTPQCEVGEYLHNLINKVNLAATKTGDIYIQPPFIASS